MKNTPKMLVSFIGAIVASAALIYSLTNENVPFWLITVDAILLIANLLFFFYYLGDTICQD